MTVIYDSYDDEPQDQFEHLTAENYCLFYDLEMSAFSQDHSFFTKHLQPTDTILELGIGTGRLAGSLKKQGYNVFGIDISLPMLKFAKKRHHLNLACMDITRLSFSTSFDQIFAPYNLLNLLCTEEKINACLQQIRQSLNTTGFFSADIFILSENSELAQMGKSFQFQIIDYPEGRLIKEIVREYQFERETIKVEERYRLRPRTDPNRDYKNIYHIAALSISKWKSIFEKNHFEVVNVYGDYDFSQIDQNSKQLLITVKK